MSSSIESSYTNPGHPSPGAVDFSAPDLTRHPPRSPRTRLGGYVQANATPRRHGSEIAAWSDWFEQLTPTSPESRQFFNEVHQKNAPHRDDIATWFDWVELDDFVTFGGRA